METSTYRAASRLHPVVVAAAASVTIVSLLGAAAIAGLFPASHGKPVPADMAATISAPAPGYLMPAAAAPLIAQPAASVPLQATPTRFQTADGRVFEEVRADAPSPSAARTAAYPAERVHAPAPVVHRKLVHHHAQTAYREPAYREPAYRESADRQPAHAQAQPDYPQHPVRTYVNDMNPVGTGLGAVLGGVLGHQVGRGNGKKLATVAGVLLGGYAGNELAHDRNPLPFSDR